MSLKSCSIYYKSDEHNLNLLRIRPSRDDGFLETGTRVVCASHVSIFESEKLLIGAKPRLT
jgi:hypothetical protein